MIHILVRNDSYDTNPDICGPGPGAGPWQLVHKSMTHAGTFQVPSMCESCMQCNVAHG